MFAGASVVRKLMNATKGDFESSGVDACMHAGEQNTACLAESCTADWAIKCFIIHVTLGCAIEFQAAGFCLR